MSLHGTQIATWAGLERAVTQSNDSRIGAARDNSTGGSLSHAVSGINSASITTLLATLGPVSIYALICFLFVVFLRLKFPRVYAPRTFLSSLEPRERSQHQASGWLNWVLQVIRTPDYAVIDRISLDAYFFLRYLKVTCVICLVGCCITLPVLLPVHISGGGGKSQLDKLSFGNVSNPQLYYIHAFLAWVFFGFILCMVVRECVFYINLRQAYLLSPSCTQKPSSKTVLFTSLPVYYRDQARLRKVFGHAAKTIWIPCYSTELDDLVKERDQSATRLEKAEIQLIKLANRERCRAFDSRHPDIEFLHTKDPDLNTAKDSTSDIGSQESTISKPLDHQTRAEKETTSLADETYHSPSPTRRPYEPQDAAVSNIDNPKPADSTSSEKPPSSRWKHGAHKPSDSINGSVAAQWVPHSWRPSHRPLANYGRRVDTIKWTRKRLKELGTQVQRLRWRHKHGKELAMPAVFIEFDSQANAQSAYQSLTHHRALHMTPHIHGIRPEEINWASLRMKWWEKVVRKFSVNAFIAAMVIFWSLPAALVGVLSNIKFLASRFTFLHWINGLPKPVLGLMSGLLPPVALSLLMALVPYIMRVCAKQAGIPTRSMIEVFVLKSYFIFQVVQVFLVTTITSAASAAFTRILRDPSSAQSILSENLPLCANFYVSYFLVQGLGMSANRIAHIPSLIMSFVPPPPTPRLIYKRYHRLQIAHWGGIYPVFTNMGVIAISYCLIAPQILGFALIGFSVTYFTYKYNILYIYSAEPSTQGLLYPHALKQTLVGVYIAEICLTGLFALRTAIGPVVMTLVLTIFTALVHLSLNDALGPLLYNLPRTLAAESDESRQPDEMLEAPVAEDPLDTEAQRPYGDDFDPGAPRTDLDQQKKAVERAPHLSKLSFGFLRTLIQPRIATYITPTIRFLTMPFQALISPDPSNANPNLMLKFLHPEIYADHLAMKSTLLASLYARSLEVSELEAEDREEAFFPPSVRKALDPVLWIPCDGDGARVSEQELKHSGEVVKITDRGSWLERGRGGGRWRKAAGDGGRLVIGVDVDGGGVGRRNVAYR